MKQKLIIANGSYEQLDSWIGHVNCVFLVCDRSVSFQKISSYFEEVSIFSSLISVIVFLLPLLLHVNDFIDRGLLH